MASRFPIGEESNTTSNAGTVNPQGKDDMLKTGFIQITGFKTETSESTLKNFLENKGRNKVGDVAELLVYRETGRAFARFYDPKVARHLCESGETRVLEGAQLKFRFPDEDALQYIIYKDRTLKVTDFPHGTTKDALMYFLENPNNGGGNIAIIRMLDGDMSAIVTFEAAAVAQNVLTAKIRFHSHLLKMSKPYDNLACTSRKQFDASWDHDVEKESARSRQDIKPELRRPINEGRRQSHRRSEHISEDPIKQQTVKSRIGSGVFDNQGVNDYDQPSGFHEKPKYGRQGSSEHRDGGPSYKDDMTHNAHRGDVSTRDLTDVYSDVKIKGQPVQEIGDEFGGAQIMQTQSSVSYDRGGSTDVKSKFSTPITQDESSRGSKNNSIVVRGLSKDTGKDVLTYYFEGKSANGGDVANVEINTNLGCALVTFESSEVAERLLAKGEVDVDHHRLLLFRPLSNRIKVAAIKRSTSKDTVINYFENRRHSHGGPIDFIDHKQKEGKAIISFGDQCVAQQVIAKRYHRLEGSDLKVDLCKWDEHLPFMPNEMNPVSSKSNQGIASGICESQSSSQTYPSGRNANVDATRTTPESTLTDIVLIKGSEGESLEQLCDQIVKRVESALCKAKRVEYLREKRHIVVWLTKHLDVMKCAIKLTVNNLELLVQAVDNTYAKCLLKNRCIKVELAEPTIAAEHIELFFENTAKSGGGPVENVVKVKGEKEAIVVFNDPTVAERVLQQGKAKIDKKSCTTKALLPSDFPVLISGPVEEDKFILKGLPRNCTADTVKQYFKTNSLPLKSVLFSMNPGVVLVEFGRKLDYNRLCSLLVAMPLESSMLSVEKVAKPNSVQVTNLGNISDKDVTLYFESKPRSGGRGRVEIHRDQDLAIIEFANNVDLAAVLERPHTLSGRLLQVKLLYGGLGPQISSHPKSSTISNIPSNIILCVSKELVPLLQSSKTARQTVENGMNEVNAIIIWPKGDWNDNNVTLTIEPQTTTKQQFQVKITECWDKTMRLFYAHRLTVSSDLFSKLLALSGKANMQLSDEDDVIIDIDYDNYAVTISGPRTKITSIVSYWENLKKDLESGHLKTERTVRLCDSEMKLFLANDCFNGLQQKYKNVQFLVKRDHVIVCGLHNDVGVAEEEIYNLQRNVCHATVTISPLLGQLAQNKTVEDRMLDLLKQNRVVVVLNKTVQGLEVCTQSQSEAVSAKRIIEENLVEKTIKLNDSMMAALQPTKLDDLKTRLRTVYHDRLIIQEMPHAQAIILATMKDIVKQLQQSVCDFVSENQFMDCCVSMLEGEAKFIWEYRKSAIQSLSGKHKEDFINIERLEKGLRLKGQVREVLDAAKDIESLKKNIKSREHAIRKQGTAKLFLRQKGKDYIQTLERQERVIIEVIMPGQLSEKSSRFHEKKDSDAQKRHVIRCCVDLGGGKKIYVAQGGLPYYPVDGIVIAANADLKPSAGLTLDIFSEGGTSIDKACISHIQMTGKLGVTETFVSTAGDLPCKFIVHAVVPKWKDGLQLEAEKLRETVYNSLKAAASQGAISVAMPLMGAGKLYFPLHVSSDIIVEAAGKFLVKQRLSIKEIHLVDMNHNAIVSIEKVLKQQFGEEKVDNQFSNQVDSMDAGVGAPPKPVVIDTSRFGFDNTTEYTGTRSLQVKVVPGHIESEASDVIVNTADPKLHFTGSVAKKIIGSAGPEVKQECRGRYPNGINCGDVVDTTGGKLNCRKLYHVSCAEWDHGKGYSEQVLRDTVKKCLQKAEAQGMRSISFPALGAGKLRVPPFKVAQMMFDEMSKFRQSTTASLQVNIVVYPADKDILQAFENEKAKHRSLVSPGGARMDQKGKPRDRNLADPTDNTETTGAAKGATAATGQKKGALQFGNCTLQVKEGDITRERVDAIVNSTSEYFDLRGGAVSAAITKAAGPTFTAECQRIGRITNHVEVTGPGNLPCQYVIHIAAPAYKTQWRVCVQEVLKIAEKYRLKSVSFPALGTGNMGLDPEFVAEIMISALAEHTEKYKTLESITLCIYQRSMVRSFEDALDKLLLPKQEGMFSRIKKAATAFWWDDDKKANTAAQSPSQAHNPQHVPAATLTIFGDSRSVIDRVITQVEAFCSQECTTDYIRDPLVSHIALPERTKLKGSGATRDVVVIFRKADGTEFIELEGGQREIQAVKTDAEVLLKQIKTNQEAEKERITKEVAWCYFESNTLKPYHKDINIIIEKAKINGESKAKWYGDHGDSYEINFSSQRERVGSAVSTGAKVERIALLPDLWEPMGFVPFETKPLQKGTSEYMQVERYLIGTVKTGVIMIQRIQNPALYRKYIMKKTEMGRNANERKLYHGTSSDVIDTINAKGFNRSVASGPHATGYGKGVYFTISSEDAVKFSNPDRKSQRFMYQCRVLTGESTQGERSLTLPPLKDPKNSNKLYDSVVDNSINPGLYVIFAEAQAYPDYLITFR